MPPWPRGLSHPGLATVSGRAGGEGARCLAAARGRSGCGWRWRSSRWRCWRWRWSRCWRWCSPTRTSRRWCSSAATDLASSLAADAVSTYNTGSPGWYDVDLSPALELAGSDGAQAAVLDARGKVVASTLAGPAGAAGVVRRPLVPGRATDRHRAGPVHRPGPGRLGGRPARLAGPRRDRRGRAGRRAGAAGGAAGFPADHPAGHPADRVGPGDGPAGTGRRAWARSPVLPPNCGNSRSPSTRWPTRSPPRSSCAADLVADVAHELRTPVAVLQANTEALLDGVFAHTPEQTASLHEEVLRLGRMVEDLQTLAAAEAAALQLSLAECDLDAGRRSRRRGMGGQLRRRRGPLRRRLEPTPVLADPGRRPPGHRQPAQQRAEVHATRRARCR